MLLMVQSNTQFRILCKKPACHISVLALIQGQNLIPFGLFLFLGTHLRISQTGFCNSPFLGSWIQNLNNWLFPNQDLTTNYFIVYSLLEEVIVLNLVLFEKDPNLPSNQSHWCLIQWRGIELQFSHKRKEAKGNLLSFLQSGELLISQCHCLSMPTLYSERFTFLSGEAFSFSSFALG